MKSFNEYLKEGLFDFLKKKKESKPEYHPLTDEQRSHIKKHFPHSNVDMRMGGPSSSHVLTHNAHANHGSLRIAFRNENGKLKASVAHHANASDARNPKVVPAFHSDHDAQTDEHMKHIKSLSK